jgi:hypothetical protein
MNPLLAFNDPTGYTYTVLWVLLLEGNRRKHTLFQLGCPQHRCAR